MNIRKHSFGFLITLLLTSCAIHPSIEQRPVTSPPAEPSTAKPEAKPTPPKVALVLGGGAVRGFAHVGVIKVLEAQGIVPDMVIGTSAGSVVGALYSAGYSGFELQKIAFKLDEDSVGDWAIPGRGFIKGEALQNYINKAVRGQPIEKLKKPFAAVATDLQSGEQMVFRRGNTGQAVRASSSVPGVFQPVTINGREYVDGGLTSPVPVRVAREMGADVVIAIDIAGKPKYRKVEGLTDVLLQTFAIMGQSISSRELLDADVVIRPETGSFGSADFDKKHEAILEGEKAAQALLPLIRQKLQQAAERKPANGAPR
ncbi:MAG TPA: patatin-like phospholipase family protein [Methylophilaceae bacterium]|nr:patatin-like phospholipase family protein [Methylophilaceae bacterium]HQR60343.1 patatin-like phospholipase family protein [Methylophilaceae bacterium]